MPRFYVDVSFGDQTVTDENGLEANSVQAARRLAILDLTELLRTAARTDDCTVTASLSGHDRVELLRATLSLRVQRFDRAAGQTQQETPARLGRTTSRRRT